MSFSRNVLKLDLEAKAQEMSARLEEAVLHKLKRRGVVVAISGGIDSACVAALSVRALGPRRVFGLIMPEKDSRSESQDYGVKLARKLGIDHQVVNISPLLEAAGCYQARDEAVRSVFPPFTPACKWKIVLPGDRLNSDALNLYHVVVRTPDGEEYRIRLTPEAYLQIVAATNFKQRARKMMEYYHADRLIFAVTGTPNRLAYDQGFFVKLGSGAADVKPIAALYKTQTYDLARHLGVIEEILTRVPTADTYSLDQSQEESYFSVHHGQLDLILWARNHKVPAATVSRELGYTVEQIERVYRDIEQKRRSSAYRHAPALMLEEVADLKPFAIR